jgi:hypothetical protein
MPGFYKGIDAVVAASTEEEGETIPLVERSSPDGQE